MTDSNTVKPGQPAPDASPCDRSQGNTQDEPGCDKADRSIPGDFPEALDPLARQADRTETA